MKITAQSLLPLLAGGPSDIRLEVDRRSENNSTAQYRAARPFRAICDNHPLASIFTGRFVTSTGTVLKKVFLVVQKDNPRTIRHDHRPLANSEIDLIWRQGFSYLAAEQEEEFFTFAVQYDSGGNLQPYKPLFYCIRAQTFFHPPCPACGSQLKQCYDDEMLQRAGLGSYSHSSRRYLYCRECVSGKDAPPFYALERHSAEPQTVSDFEDLIAGYSRLAEGGFQLDILPCLSCKDLPQCYGKGNKSADRIIPFAFYDFYLFIHGAQSLHPMDFLALAGGATEEEVRRTLEKTGEHGRLESIRSFFPASGSSFSFLCRDHEKWPVEVLYLKINFLSQLFSAAQPLFNREKGFDFFLPLEQFWIRVTEYDRHLPFCWNFKTVPIGPGLTAGNDESPGLKPPAAGTIFNMALIWFYALLYNKHNDINKIYDSLAASLDDQALDDFTILEQKITSGQMPLLEPVNILWDPAAASVNEALQHFWLRVVRLGWQLFRASYNLEPGWSVNAWAGELDDLVENVGTVLLSGAAEDFVSAPAVSQAGDKQQLHEDAVIGEILLQIIEKWREEPTLEKEGAAGDEDEILATQILQRPDMLRKTAETGKEVQGPAEVLETRIISGQKNFGKAPSKPAPAQGRQQSEETEQTVIISGREARVSSEKPHTPAGHPAGEKPGGKKEEKRLSGTEGSPDDAESKNDALSETVIISPEELAKLRRKT